MAKTGRPSKNNCDYFRHFTTMRNHRKVKALRNKFGQVLGYAFWAMILEYLTQADGNEIEYSDMEIELFAGELGVSATEIRDMVDFCVRMEMLFVVNGFIKSNSLDEELKFVYDKREIAKEISETRKRREDGTFDSNAESLGVSVTESTNGQDISAKKSPQIREDKIIEEKKGGDAVVFSENGLPKKTQPDYFENYEKWTIQIKNKSDQYFEQKLMNSNYKTLTQEQICVFADSHLGLLSRYPKMEMSTVTRFRQSLMNHIQEQSEKKTTKPNNDFSKKETARAYKPAIDP